MITLFITCLRSKSSSSTVTLGLFYSRKENIKQDLVAGKYNSNALYKLDLIYIEGKYIKPDLEKS